MPADKCDDKSNNGIISWLKENAWNLMLTMFLIGGAYGTVEVKNAWRDERINIIKVEAEKHQVRIEENERKIAETRFAQNYNTTRIDNLVADNKSTQKDVSDIKSQISVLSSKMDTVVDLLKKQTQGGGK